MPRKNVTHLTTKTPPHGTVIHPVEFDQFAQRMVLRKRLGDSAIQGEMATQLVVNPDTLSDWKKRDGCWAQVKPCRQAFLQATLPDILDAAIQAATRDRFSDRKRLLALAEEYLP